MLHTQQHMHSKTHTHSHTQRKSESVTHGTAQGKSKRQQGVTGDWLQELRQIRPACTHINTVVQTLHQSNSLA